MKRIICISIFSLVYSLLVVGCSGKQPNPVPTVTVTQFAQSPNPSPTASPNISVMPSASPTSNAAELNRRDKGLQYANQREYKKAIEEYKAYLKEYPQDALGHYYLGSAYSALEPPRVKTKAYHEFRIALKYGLDEKSSQNAKDWIEEADRQEKIEIALAGMSKQQKEQEIREDNAQKEKISIDVQIIELKKYIDEAGEKAKECKAEHDRCWEASGEAVEMMDLDEQKRQLDLAEKYTIMEIECARNADEAKYKLSGLLVKQGDRTSAINYLRQIYNTRGVDEGLRNKARNMIIKLGGTL